MCQGAWQPFRYNCAFEFLGLPFSFPRRVVYCICSNFSKQCSDLQCHLEVKGAVEPSLTNKWKKVDESLELLTSG